jgi:glycosyltransferase involved in cell wall biosynthesis
MARLRIAHVFTKLDLSGSQQNTLYSVSHLNPDVFETHLIAGPGGSLDDEVGALLKDSLHFCGELSREVRPLADYQAYNQLRELLKELRPDIVHTHEAKAGVLGRLAASAETVPYIVHTYHSFAFHRFQTEGVFRLSTALEREAARRSDHLIFVSWENAKWAEELDLIQDCPTSLIRPGVEVERLLGGEKSDEFREKYSIRKKGKVVAMISPLKAQKDPITFVDAADIVSRKEPNVKFLLFGDGEMAESVHRRAEKLQHRHCFLHAGWTRDVAEVFANVDLLIVPSLWEGLPREIPEATIAGVPVIASDVDGNREVIFQGRNGMLAEPHNPEDFAQKILQALDEEWKVDPELSRQIQHEYDIREMLHQEEAVYLKLTSEEDGAVETRSKF